MQMATARNDMSRMQRIRRRCVAGAYSICHAWRACRLFPPLHAGHVTSKRVWWIGHRTHEEHVDYYPRVRMQATSSFTTTQPLRMKRCGMARSHVQVGTTWRKRKRSRVTWNDTSRWGHNKGGGVETTTCMILLMYGRLWFVGLASNGEK
jgi:hypothetical protein